MNKDKNNNNNKMMTMSTRDNNLIFQLIDLLYWVGIKVKKALAVPISLSDVARTVASSW